MYFKTLQIPYLKNIQDEVLKIIPPEAFSTEGSLHSYSTKFRSLPSIAKLLVQNKIHKFVIDITLVCLPPHRELGIHTDGDLRGLNIPILNCENTYIIWYTALQESRRVSQEDRYFFGIDKNHCVERCRTEMNQAKFVDLQPLHGAINPNDTYRLLLSIKLDHSFKF